MTLHYFKIRAAYHGGSCRIILAWSCVVLNGIAWYGIGIGIGMASVWYCMIWYSIYVIQILYDIVWHRMVAAYRAGSCRIMLGFLGCNKPLPFSSQNVNFIK